MSQMELFVPGRLCLLGEHSDWAGMNRMMNAAIVPGQAIVSGINQGIYASVEKADTFIVESEIEAYAGEHFSCPMDTELLRETAKKGGFFSYVAGVASYVNEHFSVKGIRVNVTRMDLPIRSGLSSSAAICVLVARAFNLLYHLNLNTAGEMHIAYMGEQRTPSRCGRLDQACAYGVNPVRMVFDGNDIQVRPLRLKKPLYYVVADLHAGKDTIRILGDLNRCFPFAETALEKKVQEALGPDNSRFIDEAVCCIENGDHEKLGQIMEQYQQNFDLKVAPACPEELSAPVLHGVLKDERLRPYIYGAKGVGSQGDGSVQFLARDEKAQKALIALLKEAYAMEAFPLTLTPQKKITRAIIPVAGFGTRLFPATKILKKAFFPILGKDGILKPALLILLEQLDDAGIEEICLVVGEDEQAEYEAFFRPLPEAHFDKLPEEKKRYEERIQRIARKIRYVCQKEKLGFGHAVYQCREFTEEQPVLLLLGDMIYDSFTEKNCMQQMLDAYEQYGRPLVSLHTVPAEEVVHYGILHGQWENMEETVLKLEKIVEKPTVSYAKDYLSVETRENGENYYAVFGQYVLTKDIFDALKDAIDKNKLEKGEIQLTGALEEVRSRTGMFGVVIQGRSYDIGLPEKYLETISTYGKGI